MFFLFIFKLMLCFYREGIVFSLHVDEHHDLSTPPPNLSFLEVICEFTNKLMKQDKKVV